MNPKVWGPHAWFFLQSISLNYPENPTDNDKKIYKDFFLSLKNLLPCEKCRNHYNINLNKHNIDDYLTNNQTLLQWTLNIQNELKGENNNKTCSLEECVDYYNNQYNEESNNNNNYQKYILSFVCITILCMLIRIYYRYKK